MAKSWNKCRLLNNGFLVAIVGSTATGKSDVAQRIALPLNAEIISADSMQVYKGMDIGTAKILPKDRMVEHYCIDLVEPNESYSAALFQRDSRNAIESIDGSSKVPILVGGTGFYVRACIDDYDFLEGGQTSNPIRQKYDSFLEENGSQELWSLLNRLDPKSASVIHPNNSKRVLRALEMNERGSSYFEQANKLQGIEQVVPSIMVGLRCERSILYERCNMRVDRMREAGLIDEVASLLDRGFRDSITAPQAIGYKEIVSALDGRISFDEAFEQIKLATRRYAKRQCTWFNKDKRIEWIDVEDKDEDAVCEEALRIVGNRGQGMGRDK